MSDFFGNLGKATNNLFNTIGKETTRIFDEAGRHVTESIDEITKQTAKGGLFMGAATAVDKLSPGNVLAGAVDSVIPGKDLPQPLVDGISAAGNIAVGAVVGGPVGAVVGLIAAVDGLQAIGGAVVAGANGQAPTDGQRMQTPEAPSDALARKEHPVHVPPKVPKTTPDNAGLVIDIVVPGGGGWSAAPGVGEGDHGIEEGSGVRDEGRAGRERLKKIEADARKVDAEIEKILSNPNLSFEDMVFLLMRALIKQSNLEVKGELQAEKNSRSAARAAESKERTALQTEESSIAKAKSKLASSPAGAEREGALAKLGERQQALAARRENFATNTNEATESRQERFEELKQAMQKISEMEQALSNIMNALHQTAMNAIGNIR
jgi:hypothetical protein